MAEITYRRRGELVRKAFEILLGYPDGLQAKLVLEQIEKSLPLTDFEQDTYPNRPGIRRFEKTVRFATIPHVKAGWLVKSKGKWTLTNEGIAAFKKYHDPEEFDRRAVTLYKEWAASEKDSSDILSALNEVEDDKITEEAFARATLEEAEEGAWQEIRDYLASLNPYDFQDLVAALLRAMGYHIAWNAPPGPDKGVDIVAFTDPLGTKPPRIKVQVKRRADKISVEVVRSFIATLGEEDVGLFVSTGGFTKEAENEARNQERRKITLLGLEQLFDLWVQHYDNLDQEGKRLLPLKPIYYFAPTD